jgi:hypothetical protein
VVRWIIPSERWNTTKQLLVHPCDTRTCTAMVEETRCGSQRWKLPPAQDTWKRAVREACRTFCPTDKQFLEYSSSVSSQEIDTALLHMYCLSAETQPWLVENKRGVPELVLLVVGGTAARGGPPNLPPYRKREAWSCLEMAPTGQSSW